VLKAGFENFLVRGATSAIKDLQVLPLNSKNATRGIPPSGLCSKDEFVLRMSVRICRGNLSFNLLKPCIHFALIFV
jgi:hypothetical protein